MSAANRAPRVVPYAAALAITAVAVALRWVVDPFMGDSLPLATLFGAVALSAWFGGSGPAVVASLVGYLACNWLFIEPRGGVHVLGISNAIGLAIYLMSCALVIAFGEAMRRALAQRRLAEAELRQSRDVLALAMRGGRMGAWSRQVATDRVWWSPELEEIFGLAPGGFEGREDGFFEYVHPADRAAVRAAVDDAVASHRDYTIEFRFRHAAGEWRWMDGRGMAVYDAQGRPTMIYGVDIDITERKRAGEALRKSEERLRLSHQAAGIGTWEWVVEGDELFWSPEFRAIYGLDSACEPSFEAGRSAVVEEDRDAVAKAVESALRPGGEFRSEHRIRHPSRGLRWVASIGRTLCDDEGRPARMIGVAMDVTERHQAEQALRDADQRKDEFLAMLAHELRNPLAPIINATHVLRQLAPRDAHLDQLRRVIERQTAHLQRLVEDLLDLSRITQGRLLIKREPVDLGKVVAHAIETSRPLIDARRHRLETALPDHEIRLEADATRIAQAISNLLNNAAKYTDAGGTIRLTAEARDGMVSVCVSDSGIGISPEHLTGMFELFGQVSTSRERSLGGLGIGLALVRRIVEMHDGSVEAASDGPGRGSRFTIRLRTAPPDGDGAVPRAPQEEQAAR